jgi:LacI family transcriptional regulator
LEEHNLRVPEDLIVTGFDDVAMSRTVGRGLTTIRQSVFELGAAAVDTLVGLLENKIEKGSMVTLPTNLVVRGTCGCSGEVAA